jgi:hypothetical protein
MFSARRSTKTRFRMFSVNLAPDIVCCSSVSRFSTPWSLTRKVISFRVRALLKREGYCGILTMSDDTRKTDALGNVTFPGQIGTIFQSDNAVYLGRSAKSIEYLFDDGTVLSNRSFSKLVNNESGWRYVAGKLEDYGASDCPGRAGERRAWGFYWRQQLTRKQRNFGKLRYAWSLHPKVRLPRSLSYPRFRLRDLQRSFFAAD